MKTSNGIGPTRLTERVELVDILRGFAILGILLVNLSAANATVYGLVINDVVWPQTIDKVAVWFVRMFGEGKFYPLFSMLFGWGLATQMARAEVKGVAFVPLYSRRLLVLLLIGLVHAFLMWEGDILVIYAVMGFVLLLFRHRSPKTLLIWSAIGLSIPILANLALFGLVQLGYLSGAGPSIEQGFAAALDDYRAQASQAVQVYSQGSYGEILQQRVKDLAFLYISSFFFFIPNVFGMLLLGLYVGRRGITQAIPSQLPLFRRLLVWGFGLGLVGNLVYVYSMEVSSRAVPSAMTIAGAVGYGIGGPALMLGYVAALTLLAQQPAWEQRLAVLAPVGRMAMTNYLTHSLLYNVIFYSHGFGLLGQVGPATLLVLGLLIFAGQIVVSHWWLRRFQFGPIEWVWRSLTYLKPQPMRIPASPELSQLGRAQS